MAKTNSSQGMKRVDAVDSRSASALVRGKDGSAFTREECKKDVPVALISMHSCSLEAKIKMNLSQVVEAGAEVKKPEKKPKSKEPNAKRAKAEKVKKVKDPNMPKRPATAFFLFDDFRKSFKEENPDSKDVKRVGKEGGEKWRSMTDEEKKPYLDKFAELKVEYEKAMETYKSPGNGEEEQAGSDKSDKEAAPAEVEELTDEIPQELCFVDFGKPVETSDKRCMCMVLATMCLILGSTFSVRNCFNGLCCAFLDSTYGGHGAFALTFDLVSPGVEPTMATSLLFSLLIRLLFPTFGSPMTSTVIG
uniref:Similar to high mobility group B protein 7 n=1 Tax=Lupinus angustifolius TaxID=3871 RepID=A0A0D6DQI2_LUPAN|nr:similar to high mobility group B protein 7 [Lupinus angustifolius]